MRGLDRRSARLALPISGLALLLVAALELTKGNVIEAIAIVLASAAAALAFAAEWPEIQHAVEARRSDEGALDRLDEIVTLPEPEAGGRA